MRLTKPHGFRCLLGLVLGQLMCFHVAFSQDLQTPKMAPASPGPWTAADFRRVTIRVTDTLAFRKQLEQHLPGLQVKIMSPGLFQLTGLTPESFLKLRKLPAVAFVDRGHRQATVEAAPGYADFSVNRITTAQGIFPAIAGTGNIVSVKEKPFDKDDIDFRGRVVTSVHFDEPSSLHATFMATLAAGAGNSEPSAKGGGWSAGITTSDFSRLLPDLNAELSSLGVSVQNHSYGVGVENFYGIESAEYDAQLSTLPQLLHVFSAGNEGDKAPATGTYAGITGYANLTGQFKTSKNTLTVGSTNRLGQVLPLSSKGPAHDGRIKPELMAFGESGSSESAAMVSGIALMIADLFEAVQGHQPAAAMVKAILINSAKDAGRPHVDYDTGFGNADAVEALQLVNAGRFSSGQVSAGETTVLPVTVPSGQHLFKVTLVWSDPPALPFAASALINDLDLEVRSVSTGETWEPWILNSSPSLTALQEVAQRGKDRLNNVEQVTIDLPAGGAYEIMVKGFSIPQGPQSFHIAYHSQGEFAWAYPVQSDAMVPDTVNLLRWNWFGPSLSAVLDFRYAGQFQWSTLDPAVDLQQASYAWQAPDTSAIVEFRMTIGPDQWVTGNIVLSPAERIRVGFDCANEVLLFWRPVPNASSYRIFSLGDEYLGQYQEVSDTLVILTKPLASSYYSVVPVIDNNVGSRERTVDIGSQAAGCYFKGFLAREYVVTDSAVFDLTLGTSYRVNSVTLMRLSGPSHVPVDVVFPVTSTGLVLTDPDPLPGSYAYQARIELQDGRVLLSEEEQVLFVREDDVYVFPNPVSRTDLVSVIISDPEAARIELLDLHGRVVRSTEDTGPEKNLAIADLDNGFYLIRIQRSTGQTWIRRLLVLD